MYTIDYNSFRSIKSFNRRVRFLIFHYTAQNFENSIISLTGNAVSAHYLIPDTTDRTYIERGFTDKRIFSLVDEKERAWHAGVSYWAGHRNLNDTSIGIEIVNCAADNQGVFDFPPFQKGQIDVLISLVLNILQRYPDITPLRILGHSDIAVGRKSDPGAAFPWETLYKAGIGAWYEQQDKQRYIDAFSAQGLPSQNEVIEKLKHYGYDTQNASTAQGFSQLIRAFQLHFRSSNYDGHLDIETAAIIYALVYKYFPASR